MKTNIDDGLLNRASIGALLPFILITACFALWGFANDVTNPMVGAFSKIFRMNVTEAAMVPVAFNLGYFCMAFPAAMVTQRYSFKTGVVVGLALYALGALLFIPARSIGAFFPFLLAYFILTCGLSFLETSCNPYIYCMGAEDTGVRRLNMAQAFNPLGALVGMSVAMGVQANLSPVDTQTRQHLPLQQFNLIKDHDLGVLIQPYVFIAAMVIIMLVLVLLTKMQNNADTRVMEHPWQMLTQLLRRPNYREGVIAEFFYTGAQVTCWTFIIQYASRIFMAEGMTEHAAGVLAAKYNMAAMVVFAIGRFVCTWLLKYIPAGRLLTAMAVVGATAVLGAILFTDRSGLYCLVAVSACMSLMFPTIYGTALRGMGENVKFAGAGLIMAIIGGSIFPPLQAAIIDAEWSLFGIPAINFSFFIPLICLAVVAWYGHRTYVRHYITGEV
ncbi:MAG: L-fucose:H+ symporter permease [Prevotella sp.]|nr:L-fucose:H+ symporter permease [Prevotella sp.]